MGDFEERLKEQELEEAEKLGEQGNKTRKINPRKISDPREGPIVPNPDEVPEPMNYVPRKPRKSHLKQLVVFFGVIVVILIIISIAVSSGVFSSRKISEKQLIVGASLTMEENKSKKVEVGEDQHEIEVENVGDDWVEIVIRSDPLRFRLEVNEVIEIDLDRDGMSDLRVKLFKIQNGKAVIAVKRIDKEACIEDWICDDWGDCVGDKRERVCTDMNECGSEFFVPIREQRCVGDAPVEINETQRTVRKIGHLNDSSNAGLNNQIQNQTQNKNQTQDQNQTWTNNTNLCPNGQYHCDESKGYFCRYPSLNNADESLASGVIDDVICCSVPCTKFVSEEHFCDVNEGVVFSENETHICTNVSVDYFNGDPIHCCIKIEKKVNEEENNSSDQIDNETSNETDCQEPFFWSVLRKRCVSHEEDIFIAQVVEIRESGLVVVIDDILVDFEIENYLKEGISVGDIIEVRYSGESVHEGGEIIDISVLEESNSGIY